MGLPQQRRSPPPIFALAARDRNSRHEARVRQFSVAYARLTELRTIATDPDGATAAIEHVCRLHGIPEPAVTFHGGRGPHTGYCLAPGWRMRLTLGEAALLGWERKKGRVWPEEGMIRLGKRPALGTIAHELGHHLVNQLEHPGVPAHGNVWVGWFDEAAAGIVDWAQSSGLDLDRRAALLRPPPQAAPAV